MEPMYCEITAGLMDCYHKGTISYKDIFGFLEFHAKLAHTEEKKINYDVTQPLDEHWSGMVPDLDTEKVKIVMEQAKSTQKDAEDSLIRNDGDVINAIMDLTI